MERRGRLDAKPGSLRRPRPAPPARREGNCVGSCHVPIFSRTLLYRPDGIVKEHLEDIRATRKFTETGGIECANRKRQGACAPAPAIKFWTLLWSWLETSGCLPSRWRASRPELV